MVREIKYAIYNMGHAWQKGCYTLPAKIERPPNGVRSGQSSLKLSDLC